MTTVKNGKVTRVAKTDNLVKAQLESMRDYGRKYEQGSKSKTDSMIYIGEQVRDGLVTVAVATDHADYQKELKKSLTPLVSAFYAGQREINSNLSMLSEQSLNTYVSQYVLVASPKVFANLKVIESAVAAYTKGKTKKETHGKDYAAIFKEIASAVRKGKVKPEQLANESTSAAAITGKIKKAEESKDGGSTTDETPVAPEVLALNAFKTGLFAVLKNGKLDDATAKKIRNLAKALKIEIPAE